MASILEVGVNGERFFNVFDAAPENERNAQQAQLKVMRLSIPVLGPRCLTCHRTTTLSTSYKR